MKKFGKNSKVDETKQIAKLKNDQRTLKRHLKVTRHNNGVLKGMVDKLKLKNEEIEDHLQESIAKIASGTNDVIFMNKTIDQSQLKIEELEKKIEELKTIKSNLDFDLENCKSTEQLS